MLDQRRTCIWVSKTVFITWVSKNAFIVIAGSLSKLHSIMEDENHKISLLLMNSMYL